MWRGSTPSGKIPAERCPVNMKNPPKQPPSFGILCVFFLLGLLHGNINPKKKKRRPEESQLIARLFSHVAIHDKKKKKNGLILHFKVTSTFRRRAALQKEI